MQAKERIFVYGALAGLAAAVALQFPARTASADRYSTDLGPADSLILTGKSGNLTVRNADGHLQWGDQATSRALALGAVHSDRVLRALLKSERMADERKSLEEEAKSKDDDFRRRYKDLEEKYKDVDPKSPNFEDARKEMNAFFEEANSFRTTISTRFAKMRAGQYEKAYKDMVAAVDLVAERQKIDVVFRFVPTGYTFEMEKPEAVEGEEMDEEALSSGMVAHTLDSIRARTFLRAPESVDLTDEVMKELGVKGE